jgi:CheY-like chemotaxis protein
MRSAAAVFPLAARGGAPVAAVIDRRYRTPFQLKAISIVVPCADNEMRAIAPTPSSGTILRRCHRAATGTLQASVILSAMRPTILTVDDEPDVLELIRFHLTHAGCDVLTATSGRVALETIRACRPDLVLLDLMLPDIDGFGICEILRRQPATASLPIIIVSAWSTTDSRDLGLELGALDYLTKPFSPKTLVERVQRLLNLRPAGREKTPAPASTPRPTSTPANGQTAPAEKAPPVRG